MKAGESRALMSSVPGRAERTPPARKKGTECRATTDGRYKRVRTGLGRASPQRSYTGSVGTASSSDGAGQLYTKCLWRGTKTCAW